MINITHAFNLLLQSFIEIIGKSVYSNYTNYMKQDELEEITFLSE
jgi:hypothetical protein